MDIKRLTGYQTSVRITDVRPASINARTLFFETAIENLSFEPGQFLMIWIPSEDEIPMSISHWNPPEIGITVRPVGSSTQSLCKMREGDWIGIRGPFGTHFEITGKKALIVGGGVGMASLLPLIRKLLDSRVNVNLINAARNKDNLLFMQDLLDMRDDLLRLEIATDDGSSGFKGLATDCAARIIEEEDFDVVYTCGPELMMYRLLQLCSENGIQLQASIERFMKCGCGICGTCAVDPTGKLVCVDGPVMKLHDLQKATEFGKYYRNSVGKKTNY